MVRPLRPLAADDDAGSVAEPAAGSAEIPALAEVALRKSGRGARSGSTPPKLC
jgi:hypothetical protein